VLSWERTPFYEYTPSPSTVDYVYAAGLRIAKATPAGTIPQLDGLSAKILTVDTYATQVRAN